MVILNSKYDSNSPIGFFDSGVGGLTVLKEVKKLLPNESFIYFGDTVHVPYGEKSKDELLLYSKNILNFFSKLNCKAVVMACNTTSSVVYDDIKDNYKFRLFPVVQSVSKIISELNFNKIGVLATKATINSHAYKNEISKYRDDIQVFEQSCPDWVRIVEDDLTNNIESQRLIKSDLDKMLENNPQKIILGCTHYPYLLPVLSKLSDMDLFINPAVFFAEYIKNNLEANNLLTQSVGSEKFYVSSNPEKFRQAANMFYKLPNTPELLSF